jgi:hypothetical protein
MPRLPKLSDAEKLVITMQQHPFGALVLLLLVFLVFVGAPAAVYAIRH